MWTLVRGVFPGLSRGLCRGLSLGLALALPCLPSLAQRALDKDTREAVMRIPATAKDAFGKEMAGDIVVTTFRPAGEGPFPLVVISHGRNTDTRPQYERQRYESASRYFLRKGFAVAVPLRLGYGETAALGDPEDSVACNNPRFKEAFDAAASEVALVVKAMQQQPDIDAGRLVLVGQSVGGGTTVAANALTPRLPGLVAAVNFAGGHGGNPKTRPGEPCGAVTLERLMEGFGAKAAVPMLWVYAENDRYFNPRHSQAWSEAYRKAGGKVEYRLMPPFGDDGHELFSKGNDLWQPLVDGFLAQAGFTTPGVLPQPGATRAGRAEDLGPLAHLPEKTLDAYRTFLTQKPPRAFAFSAEGKGNWGWASGDDVLSRALANCQRRTGDKCTLYAADGDVVWSAARQP